jgi:hypothetical protein
MSSAWGDHAEIVTRVEVAQNGRIVDRARHHVRVSA